MNKISIFDKVSELKDSFKKVFQHKKKIKALENYSSSAKFSHADFLPLLKKCMEYGFVGQEESAFLEFLLNKYQVKYLDWCHKTQWLKQKMEEMQKESRPEKCVQLTLFDKQREHATPEIPLEVLSMSSKVAFSQKSF